MFGLMKPEKTCSHKHTNDYRYHRMHYCGTCKTLGQEFGQPTRMMLNFDIVFLSEILSHLSNENLETWQSGFQAINKCFTMPDKSKHTPVSLRYAAATNIVLSELKVDDNIKDTHSRTWKFTRLLLSKPFRKAKTQFKNWGLDTNQLWHWIKKQSALENGDIPKNKTLSELLEYYAEPTAQITALIFEQGAVTVGQPNHQHEMRQLGYQFGRLVYILDAFEDVEKDIFNQQFNPLTHFFNIDKTLTNNQLTEVRQLILTYQGEATQQLNQLLFSEEIIEHYTVRLYSNITDRIYRNRKIPMPFEAKVQTTFINIIQDTKQFILHKLSSARNANYYLVSMVLFIIPMAVDFLSFNHQGEIYKWGIILTAALGSLGFIRHTISKRKQRKTKNLFKKILKGEQKLSFTLLLGIFSNSSKSPCCGECCNSDICGDCNGCEWECGGCNGCSCDC